MKSIVTTFVGLVLMTALAACSTSDPEEDLRSELTEMGLPNNLIDCAVDELKGELGDLEDFKDLSASEQQEMGTQIGVTCAEGLSPEDVGDVLDGVDADLTDPAMRKSLITGITSQGVSEDVANCIVDGAIDRGLEVGDFADQAAMAPIFQECQ